MVADRLAARTDGLVDYEELYRLLLEVPPPQVKSEACMRLRQGHQARHAFITSLWGI